MEPLPAESTAAWKTGAPSPTRSRMDAGARSRNQASPPAWIYSARFTPVLMLWRLLCSLSASTQAASHQVLHLPCAGLGSPSAAPSPVAQEELARRRHRAGRFDTHDVTLDYRPPTPPEDEVRRRERSQRFGTEYTAADDTGLMDVGNSWPTH